MAAFHLLETSFMATRRSLDTAMTVGMIKGLHDLVAAQVHKRLLENNPAVEFHPPSRDELLGSPPRGNACLCQDLQADNRSESLRCWTPSAGEAESTESAQCEPSQPHLAQPLRPARRPWTPWRPLGPALGRVLDVGGRVEGHADARVLAPLPAVLGRVRGGGEAEDGPGPGRARPGGAQPAGAGGGEWGAGGGVGAEHGVLGAARTAPGACRGPTVPPPAGAWQKQNPDTRSTSPASAVLTRRSAPVVRACPLLPRSASGLDRCNLSLSLSLCCFLSRIDAPLSRSTFRLP